MQNNGANYSDFFLERMGYTNPHLYRLYLHKGLSVIGRSKKVDICLASEYISRVHCHFTVHGDTVKIRDNNVTICFLISFNNLIMLVFSRRVMAHL